MSCASGNTKGDFREKVLSIKHTFDIMIFDKTYHSIEYTFDKRFSIKRSTPILLYINFIVIIWLAARTGFELFKLAPEGKRLLTTDLNIYLMSMQQILHFKIKGRKAQRTAFFINKINHF